MTATASRSASKSASKSATKAILVLDGQHFQDPYALWAVQTNLRAFKRYQGPEPPVITFLLELKVPYDRQIHFADASVAGAAPRIRLLNGLAVTVPEAYERVLPATGVAPTFITLRLDISTLTTPAQKIAAVQAVLAQTYVKRLQIGFPRPGFGPGGAVSETPSTPPAAQSALGQSPPPRPAVVLGVLEDGCPFAHAALLRGGQTRVALLWDQSLGRSLSPPWTAAAGFPYGHQVVKADLDGWINSFRSLGSVDEEALYADPVVAMPTLLRRSSHAAAVIGLLAGDPSALPAPDNDDSHAWPGVRQGRLMDAPLVVVRLPQEQTSISAGRWLAVNALDGLHCITAAAFGLGGGVQPPPPTVVNVSYGAIAGPHDGTSMLECAMDELCSGQTDLAIVLASGNTFGTVHDTDSQDPDTCLPGGVHARQALPPSQKVQFTLAVPADKAFETYLELWFSDLDKSPYADQWLIDGEVQITLTAPDGAQWGPVPCGSQLFEPADADKARIGLLFARLASQSRHRSMALLVLAATRVHPEFVSAMSGLWTVTVANLGQRSLDVQAWVERDDTTVGANRPQSARLVPNGDHSNSPLSDFNTFSNIASGAMTVTVGALVDWKDSAGHLRASRYTAAGADDNRGPLLSAIADTGMALASIRVAGNASGYVLRTNGTSMAAPRAARWIAAELCQGKTLAQIRAAATAGRPRDARRGHPVP